MRAFVRRIQAFAFGAPVFLIALAALASTVAGAPSLVNCPPVFLGDYPDDFEGDWTEDVQGLTHDDTHWYFTQTLEILRIPVGRDFGQDHKGEPGVAYRHHSSYPELSAYNHFGDISYFNGYVLLGVDSGPPEGGLALLRGDDTLDFVGVHPLSGQDGAGWVAVDPDGFVYSSPSGASEFRKYSVNWADLETNGLTVAFVGSIPLTDENGDPYTLSAMQGGVVTPDGKVMIVSNGFDDCDNPTYGLHAFNLETGQRIIRSCESGCGWIFEWDQCTVGFLNEEPEGLTIWDLDNGAAPGMSGQLHVLLLNNDIIHDNTYIKHYDLDTTAPEITCPQAITVECSEHGGTPATDPAIAAFLAGASATDNCDDDVDLSNDAPAFFDLGTTTVTFTATDEVMLNQSACTADVTIVDTTDPVIEVSLNRDALWPPNHKLSDIEATVEVTDICDEDAGFLLESIVSSEPDDDGGDGSTTGDIAGADTGTPDTAFQLRSERQGTGAGREYTIIYSATDESGNVSYDTVTVSVPHDRGGQAFAAAGFTSDGKGVASLATRFVLVVPSIVGADARSSNGAVGSTLVLNAADLDVSRVYVGNTRAALRPVESRLLDVTDDTWPDLVVYYEAERLPSVLDELADDRARERLEVQRMEPVGLHYTAPDGADYLVPSIFALGAPVSLQETEAPPVELPVITAERPLTTSLLGAYPNPFNPSTRVHFSLASAQRVRVRVFDVKGALVRTLVDEDRPAGGHVAEWNGRDDRGGPLASGVYFVQMSAGSYQTVRKIVMLK